VEKDRAAEGKVGALDHNGFVAIALVLGGEARPDRREPTTRATVGANRLT